MFKAVHTVLNLRMSQELDLCQVRLGLLHRRTVVSFGNKWPEEVWTEAVWGSEKYAPGFDEALACCSDAVECQEYVRDCVKGPGEGLGLGNIDS